MLDAWRLREGLKELEGHDAKRAAAVRRRAVRAAGLMRPGFPADPETGLLDDDDGAEEVFAADYAALPCPVLDPATGDCDLYACRQLSCRTYGLPVRIGG